MQSQATEDHKILFMGKNKIKIIENGTWMVEEKLPLRYIWPLEDGYSSMYHNSPNAHCKSPHFSAPLTATHTENE